MPYTPDFESSLLRGEDLDRRPWDVQAEILSIIDRYEHARVLDIGTSIGRKFLPIAASVKLFRGLALDPELHHIAEAAVQEAGLTKVKIEEGNSEELPFRGKSFDVVTGRIVPHAPSEIHRVLRPKGVVIIEQLGDQDKTHLKRAFPPDEAGPRGLLDSDMKPNYEAARYCQEFGKLFSSVTVRSGFWSTVLEPEGLDLLLAQTPTIRDFDPTEDEAYVQDAKAQAMQPSGLIKVTQHRLLITAKK